MTLYKMDALKGLSKIGAGSVQCCITSPPYWGLRDYQTPPVQWPAIRYAPMAGMKAIRIGPWEGELGREPSLEAFIAHVVHVFRGVRRVLADDGTAWVNMGDGYNAAGRKGQGTREGCKQGTNRASAAGADEMRPTNENLKPKDLMGQPWRVAFALQADGWTLRQDVIWAKPNPMPESVLDRCTKAHEYLFLLSKGPRYFCNMEAIREPVAEEGRTPGNVEPSKGQAAYEAGMVEHRTKAGLLTHAQRAAVFATAGSEDCLFDLDPSPVPREGPRARGGANAFRGQGAHEQGPGAAANREGRDMKHAGYAADTRNRRSVWEVASAGFAGAHFATYPPDLIRPCVLACTRPGDIVLDIFAGSGTTGAVAMEEGRKAILIEVNPAYHPLIEKRLLDTTPGLGI